MEIKLVFFIVFLTVIVNSCSDSLVNENDPFISSQSVKDELARDKLDELIVFFEQEGFRKAKEDDQGVKGIQFDKNICGGNRLESAIMISDSMIELNIGIVSCKNFDVALDQKLKSQAKHERFSLTVIDRSTDYLFVFEFSNIWSEEFVKYFENDLIEILGIKLNEDG